MSVTAAFRFVQGTTFDVDRAAIGIPSSLVTCQWLGDGTPQEWTWTMIGAPTGSVVPLGVFGIGFNPNAYFTPDIPGGYLVELTVIDPITGQLVSMSLAFLVPEISGRIIPPFRASPQSLRTAAQVTDLQVQGWHPLMEEWLRFLESGAGGGGGAMGVDNLLGNQLERPLTTPFFTLGDKLQLVPGAAPYTILQIGTDGQLILRCEARNVALYNEQTGATDYVVVLPNRERPCGMCTDGTDVFIASETGTVYRYDATYELVGVYAGAAPVNSFKVRVEMVYVAGYVLSILDGPAVWDDTVYRIKVSDGVVATHATTFHPYGMVVDSLGGVWVGSENLTGEMTVLNPATFVETAITPLAPVNARPILSVGGKMLISVDASTDLARYTEGVTPVFDTVITGFSAGLNVAGASYDPVGDVAMVYYGLGSVGVYFLALPATGLASTGNINPGAPISNIRSACRSAFVGAWVAADGSVDTTWVITDVPGVSPYIPIAGLLGFAP